MLRKLNHRDIPSFPHSIHIRLSPICLVPTTNVPDSPQYRSVGGKLPPATHKRSIVLDILDPEHRHYDENNINTISVSSSLCGGLPATNEGVKTEGRCKIMMHGTQDMLQGLFLNGGMGPLVSPYVRVYVTRRGGRCGAKLGRR